MAGGQVTISVSYEGKEHTIPLVVRPSLELSDGQIDRADSELKKLLRQTFQLPPESRCFLYEALSRRSLSAESFRDPSNLPVFPQRWLLSVEPSSSASLKQPPSLVAHNDDYLNIYSNTYARDSSPLPSLEDLSLVPHTDHHSSLQLQCGDQGEFGLTLRHFSIRPNIPESNTPDDVTGVDSVGCSGSNESLCLSTLFVYKLEPGGPAEQASLKEGDVILKVNGRSMTRYNTAEVQAALLKCGRKVTLLVSSKECDDLQFLYPGHAYGPPGEHSTRDGTVVCCDIVLLGGSGEDGGSSCGEGLGEGPASGSLPSLDEHDSLLHPDLAVSPIFPAHSRQDSLDVFADNRFEMARSPVNFSILGTSSPPLARGDNGLNDWTGTLRNLEEMTSTESLNKLASNINPEMSPSWTQYMEDNGFPSQREGHHDDHYSLDQEGLKWAGSEMQTGGHGMEPQDSTSHALRGRRAISAHQPTPSSWTQVTGSTSALDRFTTTNPGGSGSSQGVEGGTPRVSRKGQSSLEALTRLVDDGKGGSRPDDTDRGVSRTVANVQDSWISRSDSPSKSEGSLHSQQSVGGQHGSQEHRSSGGDGGGSQNSDFKSKRSSRSYQSQRAQLHKVLGTRQSAEGDHPRSNPHLDGPPPPHTTTSSERKAPSRRTHGRSSQSSLTGPSSTPEEHKRSQDAVAMPTFVEDDDRPTREVGLGTRSHQRATSSEERTGQLGLGTRAKRPASAKVPLQTSAVASGVGLDTTTHVSIDEAIQRASQPGRSMSVDYGVVNGLGTGHGLVPKEEEEEEEQPEESSPKRGVRKMLSVQSTETYEPSPGTMPTMQGYLKKERDDGHSRRGSHSTKQLYCVVEGDKLVFYKDKKDAVLKKPCDEPPLDLTSSSVETVSDYGKKKHMMKVVCASGAEHLFHLEDEEEMKKWVDGMQGTGGIDGKRRSQPLLLERSPQNSPVPNRRAISPTPKAKRKGSDFGSLSKLMGKLWKGRGGRAEEVDSPSSSSYLTFGQPLEECPASEENKKVPLVVEYCIKEVEQNGLEAEGIYRIPGKVALINSLSADIDRGNYSQLTGGYDDIHTIGSLLKKFLKDLPDPLIPSHLYADFIRAARVDSERERMRALKELVYRLPSVHYHTLKFLLTHLYKVSQYSEANKMTINNLCLVFGPTIVRDTGGSNEIHAFQHGYNVIDPLLKNVKEFFSSDLCLEEEQEEEEEAAREAAASRLEPEREEDDVDHSVSRKDAALPNASPTAAHRAHKAFTPEGKRRHDTGHSREAGASDDNLLTAASRKGHRSSEGNIATIRKEASNHSEVSSLESTGASSFWKQQQQHQMPRKKKLSRTRQQLLTSFPPPPTGEAIQELNTAHTLHSMDAKNHRRSMPVVSTDTVISNRDLVDDVSVGEAPRNQWVEKPTGGSAVSLKQGSKKYSIDMYRAQSAAEGTRGDHRDSSSRDRSMSTSTHLSDRTASDNSSNSHRLPMESYL